MKIVHMECLVKGLQIDSKEAKGGRHERKWWKIVFE